MENSDTLKGFNYENSEIKQMGGTKIVRKVSVKHGKGYKTITKYRRGKKISSVKKPIHKEHLKMIKKGKFVKGLFNDCKNCNRTKRSR
jgi:ketol-acid reductoisomerase